eukprot:17151-Heterococcus_DN1.PRE.4
MIAERSMQFTSIMLLGLMLQINAWVAPLAARSHKLRLSAVAAPIEQGVDLTPKRADPKSWFGALQQQSRSPQPFQEIARTGAATLTEIELPHRKQEPYRYADLESLFRHSYGASNGGKVSKEFVSTYLADVSKGAQM